MAKVPRHTIVLRPGAYRMLVDAAAARGIAISQLVDAALGDCTGPDVEASLARAKSEPRKPGPVPKRPPRYVPIALVRSFSRFPSRERQLLGDGVANAMGFR